MRDGQFVVPGKTSADGGVVYMRLEYRVRMTGILMIGERVWSDWADVTIKGDTADERDHDTTDG